MPAMPAGELSFTVPAIPPSVNHYKGQSKDGHWYVKQPSTDFKQYVLLYARGQQVRGKEYTLEVSVFFGYKQRGDGDNLWKVLADALVNCGVIDSDARVTDWILHKRRDWENPRTEITVRVNAGKTAA